MRKQTGSLILLIPLERKTVMKYLSDIDSGTAQRAFNGTSFSPERRGEQVRADYNNTLCEDLKYLSKYANTDEKKAALETEFERYRQGYLKRTVSWLHTKSNCLSTMIAGPSNFPVRRAEKANNAEHKKSVDLCEFRSRALKAIEKVLRPELAPIMAGDSNAISRLTEKIEKAEKFQALMKAANKIIKKKSGIDFAALEKLGFTAVQSAELSKPDCCGRIGFAAYQLTNNNANIKRMKGRLRIIERDQHSVDTQHVGENATLEDCPADNRIRLFFEGKPAEEIRTQLKKNGFRWTPSKGCWQSYRNRHSMETAKQIAA
jgi:hypothetical protein